jgi:EmrB/QacA subfamily drug resistance transporter
MSSAVVERSGLTDPVEVNPHHARRWLILGVLGLAQLMVVLDSTVVTIALPSAQADLGFSDASRQWIVTAYALAFGSLLLVGGRLADLIGRKWTFITGLAGFAAASALGGAANSFAVLVTARAIQGGFAALLAPSGLALLTITFTVAKERAQAFGIYSAIAGSGAAIGLLLGGLLTEYASWRWTMFVNLLFAGAALFGASTLLHHTRSEHRQRLDIPGTVTISAGLFCLVYGFSHAETAGWSNAVTIASLLAAAVLIVSFLVIQTRSSSPLLPPRVLRDRQRGGALFAMFATSSGMFAIFLFLTYYLQSTMHYSAVQTGLAFLPLSFTIIITAGLVSSVLISKISTRTLVPSGMLVTAAGLAMLTRIDVHSDYVTTILPATILLAFGMGVTFAGSMSVATLGVAREDAGVASALVNVSQQVGGSVGTALLNTIAATAAANFLVGKVPSQNTYAMAAVHSYSVAFWAAAAVTAVGAVVTFLMLRPGIPQFDHESDALVVL